MAGIVVSSCTRLDVLVVVLVGRVGDGDDDEEEDRWDGMLNSSRCTHGLSGDGQQEQECQPWRGTVGKCMCNDPNTLYIVLST